MARKVEVSFFDHDKTKREGLALKEFATQLNLWDGRTEGAIHNLLQNGLDTTKYKLSTVWTSKQEGTIITYGYKTARVFAVGYSLTDQLSAIIQELAGSGNQNIKISFSQILPRIQFRHWGQREDDLNRTILHNLDPKWMDSITDKNYLTTHAATEGLHGQLPVLPSLQGEVLRAGFDVNMEVPDEVVG